MPLVIMCGQPSSGKSTRASQLSAHLGTHAPEMKVHIINDNMFSGFTKSTYSDVSQEKNLRAFLKSETQKHLNQQTIVILDSLNYIKGYRYELFCITKSAQSPHLVIWCDIGHDNARILNDRRPNDERYPEDVMNGLLMRFEEPNNRNRWDSPLFILQKDDELPLDDITNSLLHNKPAPPNMSTVAQPLQPTDFLYELDKVTNEIVKSIFAGQKTLSPGEILTIGSKDKLTLSRHYTLAELNKVRRQFITYMKMNPLPDTTQLPSVFISYLQKSI